jgi:hypothetical protein
MSLSVFYLWKSRLIGVPLAYVEKLKARILFINWKQARGPLEAGLESVFFSSHRKNSDIEG